MSFKVSSSRGHCDGLEVHTVMSTKSTETAVGHELDISKTNLRFWRNAPSSIFSYKAKTKEILQVHRGVLHLGGWGWEMHCKNIFLITIFTCQTMWRKTGKIITSLKMEDRNVKPRRGSVTSSHTRTVVTDSLNGSFCFLSQWPTESWCVLQSSAP